MSDCIFCRIGRKEAPAKIVYADPEIFAFEDIHPQAPVHLLICPRKHIASLAEIAPSDAEILGRMMTVAAQLAAEQKLTDGYRMVFNSGPGAGQSVFHLHLHLLGGRTFRWPPG